MRLFHEFCTICLIDINAFVLKNLFVTNFSFCSHHFGVRKVYCKCKVSIWTFAYAIFHWKFGTCWFCVVWENFCAELVVVKRICKLYWARIKWSWPHLWTVTLAIYVDSFLTIKKNKYKNQGGGGEFPYILLNEIQTLFSQLAKQSLRQ